MSVWGDNTRALASGLSPVHTHKPYHKIIIAPACICTCVHCETFDVSIIQYTVKPVQNGHAQKDRKLVFKTNYRLMQAISIAECSGAFCNTFDLH